MTKVLITIFALLLLSCSDNQETSRAKKSYYVPPSVNSKEDLNKAIKMGSKEAKELLAEYFSEGDA